MRASYSTVFRAANTRSTVRSEHTKFCERAKPYYSSEGRYRRYYEYEISGTNPIFFTHNISGETHLLYYFLGVLSCTGDSILLF